jgi:bifunctional oligoribonuclease and PAP phosphatase NrnA
MPVDWQPLVNAIRTRQRFVLTTHVRPDADALGSELAMAGVLAHFGKEVRIVNASATPPRLKFLDPQGQCLQLGPQISEEQALDADVHMVLDTSAWGQLAEMGTVFRRSKGLKLCIDHHVAAEDIGAVDMKDVTAEATGALVFQAARHLGTPITPEMAQAMYCAIATDTGWFRFPSTTGNTMRIIGELIDHGAKPHLLYEELYERDALTRLKLVARALDRVAVDCEGRLAWTWVGVDDFSETGAAPSDTEDLVNECLRIAGTEAAFICIEQANRSVKTSFRCRAHLDISRIAETFKGGGHKQAAGATLAGPLKDALAKVLAAMKTLFPPSS